MAWGLRCPVPTPFLPIIFARHSCWLFSPLLLAGLLTFSGQSCRLADKNFWVCTCSQRLQAHRAFGGQASALANVRSLHDALTFLPGADEAGVSRSPGAQMSAGSSEPIHQPPVLLTSPHLALLLGFSAKDGQFSPIAHHSLTYDTSLPCIRHASCTPDKPKHSLLHPGLRPLESSVQMASEYFERLARTCLLGPTFPIASMRLQPAPDRQTFQARLFGSRVHLAKAHATRCHAHADISACHQA